MVDESNSPVAVEYFLEPGHIFVALEPTFISTVLGSCVSVCLHDRKRKTVGKGALFGDETVLPEIAEEENEDC